MATIISTAAIDGPTVLPDALIEQYVKPGADQAVLLDAFRLTALGWVEGHTGLSLMRREWTATFDGFDGMGALPRGPVRSIVSLRYADQANALVDGAGLWRLAGSQLLPIAGTRWPVTDGPVSVTFVAGYDDVATEAPGLRTAALMLVKHLFDGGSLDDVPATVGMLIDAQYRTPVLG